MEQRPVMEQRVSLLSLGVDDVRRARTFYEQLGWQGQEVDETVFFQTGGQVLVLWGRDKLAADAGIELAADRASGANAADNSAFNNVVIAHNVRARDEVDRIVDAAQAAGATVTKAPAETFYGGYAGFFRDLDGHVWEIAHNPGFTIADDGSLVLPDFGSQG